MPANILVEILGEFIAVVNPEYSLEEVDVLGQLEILPCVVVVEVSNFLRDLLPFDENSLRDARILDSRFQNKDSFVREVIVDDYLPYSVVLETRLDNMFLEEGIESQNLPIVLEPWSLDSRDVVVASIFPQTPRILEFALGHLIKQVFIFLLFQVGCLVRGDSVDQLKLMCLVEILLVGIREDVTREHRHLLRDIWLHLVSCIFIFIINEGVEGFPLHSFDLLQWNMGLRVRHVSSSGYHVKRL